MQRCWHTFSCGLGGMMYVEGIRGAADWELQRKRSRGNGVVVLSPAAVAEEPRIATMEGFIFADQKKRFHL